MVATRQPFCLCLRTHWRRTCRACPRRGRYAPFHNCPHLPGCLLPAAVLRCHHHRHRPPSPRSIKAQPGQGSFSSPNISPLLQQLHLSLSSTGKSAEKKLGRAVAMAAKAVSFLMLVLLLLGVAFPVQEVEAGGNGRGNGNGNGGGSGNGNGYGRGNLKPWECSSKCASRCSQTQYHKACITFCNKCCATCLCVPPGFYGNKGACPCYNNWKTKEGGPKCP
ncbi:hypothetical protein SETIT_4G118500v2 [Setaria italica]|uniref:Uncharacterized protein n=3 Tax=Setaria TaxID=4554 RepID=A0A368QTT9_SETIT|nr:hypothetical protein SETIT_4G118500v2 [Setaria italica]